MNKTIKMSRVDIKNKAIKRRNIQRAISLVFYTGTCFTCIGLFFSMISKGNPAPAETNKLIASLLAVGLVGCLTFGKAVLVAAKRSR